MQITTAAYTYELVEIPIEAVKQNLNADFEVAKRQARLELLEALVDKLIEIKRVNTVIEEMAKTDPVALRKFRIIPEDVEMFTESIKKFKV